ncbi:MAG: tetratricopeptide repeat protein [Alphaproteobacteria bacterium]|nr:tetratricopeptide repeat protein [Alphaproteobacteria bacterium]
MPNPRPLLFTLALLMACGGARKQVRAGDDYMTRGYPDAAVRAYERALELDPKDPEIQLRVARARIAVGEPELAIGPARVAHYAEVPGSALVLAEALLALGETDDALKTIRAELEREPSPAAYAVMGEIELSRGRADAAAGWLSRAAAGGDPRHLARLAFAQAWGDDPGEARDTAVRAMAAGGDQVPVLMDLAATWQLLDDAADAMGAANTALGLDAELDEEDGGRARALAEARQRRDRGDRLGAYRLGLAAHTLDPRDPVCAWLLGRWFLEDEDFPRAAYYLNQALSLPPYAVEINQTVQRSTTTDPDPAEVREDRVRIATDLAAAWSALGNPTRAAKALEIAVLGAQGDPSPEALMSLAEAFQAAGRPADAAEMARRAADRGHPAAVAAVARGMAAAGRVDEAVSQATRGWNINRGDPTIALVLAELYASRQEYVPAMQVVETALRAHPDHPELTATLEQLRAEAEAPAYSEIFQRP